MPVGLRASTQPGNVATASSVSLDIDGTLTEQAGDVLLALFGQDDGSLASMGITGIGWSLVTTTPTGSAEEHTVSGNTIKGKAWTKTAGGAEPDVTLSADGGYTVAAVLAISGSSGLDGTPGLAEVTISGGTAGSPSVTPTVDGCLLVVAWLTEASGGTASEPGTMTRYYRGQAGGYPGILVATQQLGAGTAGVAQTRTGSGFVSSRPAIVYAFLFRPANSGQTISLSRATETDVARAVTVSKRVQLGRATEADVARGVSAAAWGADDNTGYGEGDAIPVNNAGGWQATPGSTHLVYNLGGYSVMYETGQIGIGVCRWRQAPSKYQRIEVRYKTSTMANESIGGVFIRGDGDSKFFGFEIVLHEGGVGGVEEPERKLVIYKRTGPLGGGGADIDVASIPMPSLAYETFYDMAFETADVLDSEGEVVGEQILAWLDGVNILSYPLSETEIDEYDGVSLGTVNFRGSANYDTITWSPPTSVLALGRATEADVARGVAITKRIALGRTTETDVARALATSKRVTLGRATEVTDVATIPISKHVLLGRATEVDVARGFVGSGSTALGRATETDVARGVTITKRVALGRATETDVARPVVVPSGEPVALPPLPGIAVLTARPVGLAQITAVRAAAATTLVRTTASVSKPRGTAILTPTPHATATVTTGG